jgi:predicted nucleic acid-binding protein
VIHLDTSFLIRAGRRRSAESEQLRVWLRRHEPVRISSVAWAEFLCGPVPPPAVDDAAELLGEPEPLTGLDATLAAYLFNVSGRRRGSLTDCMIAAVAINAGAELATNNVTDFRKLSPYGLTIAHAQ